MPDNSSEVAGKICGRIFDRVAESVFNALITE